MTTSAARRSTSSPFREPTTTSARATSSRSSRTRSTVEIRGGERARAQMALSIPYEPAVGDVLLVIGKGDEHYVIGVLHGSGKTSLSFQGAVDLRATGGPLTLSSDQGVAIHGPEMEIQTGKLQVFAGADGGEARLALPARARARSTSTRARRTRSWTTRRS